MPGMRIAAAQVHPAWLDPARGTTIVTDWIGKAADEGVELVAFGETFLGGYPLWIAMTDGARFDNADQKRAFSAYLDAAVELGGPEIATITEAVRDRGVFTYLGVAERGSGTGRGTVYCTLVAIDPKLGVVSAHRKLMPTYEERLAWGTGDGHGLRVHEGPGGVRVGGLNCWENWMPLSRAAMYAGGEDLHVAVWPGGVGLTKDITRFIAREGRVFVLSAADLHSAADIPDSFPLADAVRAEMGDESYEDGGSCIAGPDGEWVVAPVANDERLVCADIDVARVREERQNFDPTGHYSRPDVLHLTVNRRRLAAVEFEDGEGSTTRG
jgi:nitrilase